MAETCKHGQLARVCERCEADEENAALRSRVAELVTAAAGYRGKMQDAQARVAELEAENGKLGRKCVGYDQLLQGARESARMDREVIAKAQRERDEAREALEELRTRHLAQNKAYVEAVVERDEARAEVQELREQRDDEFARAERLQDHVSMLAAAKDAIVDARDVATLRAERAEAEVERLRKELASK